MPTGVLMLRIALVTVFARMSSVRRPVPRRVVPRVKPVAKTVFARKWSVSPTVMTKTPALATRFVQITVSVRNQVLVKQRTIA